LFCAAAGLYLAAVAWRRALGYAAIAGAIGLGGTGVFQLATDGWFWTYVYEIHQAHDFNPDRFWASFGHILGHFPAMTAAIAAGAIACAAAAARGRPAPPGAGAFGF